MVQRNEERENAAKLAAEILRVNLRLPQEIKTAIILGSGWGDALNLEDSKREYLQNLEGFEPLKKMASVPGHARVFECGSIGRTTVAVLRGRLHLNEAPQDQELCKMVRLQVEMLIHLGVKNIILTCAAGSLSGFAPSPVIYRVGDAVAIDGLCSLFAPEMPLWAGEFCSPEDCISEEMVEKALSVNVPGLEVKRGSYAMVRGPHFEGRKLDKAFLASTGANIVGMSMIPEMAIASLYDGVRVLPLAFITNTSNEEHDHETNKLRVQNSAPLLGKLLASVISSL